MTAGGMTRRSVYPSAGARTTSSVPTLVPAPGRFFDHERLVEPLREPLAHQAHDDVACSPGCDRGYNAHCARRIGLRTRDARQIRQCSSTRGQFEKRAAGNSYGGFLAERDEDAL